MKTTPGTWSWRQGSLVVWRDDLVIADCFPDMGQVRFPTPEEGRANAQLIAAAPDLLLALEWCVDLITYDGANNVSIAEYETGMNSARAAIARAKGESR